MYTVDFTKQNMRHLSLRSLRSVVQSHYRPIKSTTYKSHKIDGVQNRADLCALVSYSVRTNLGQISTHWSPEAGWANEGYRACENMVLPRCTLFKTNFCIAKADDSPLQIIRQFGAYLGAYVWILRGFVEFCGGATNFTGGIQ